MDFIKDFKVTKEAGSSVKIEGEIPFAKLEEYRGAAIKALGKNMKVDGFRAGHIPEKIVIERIGEMNILSEMAERAMAATYPEVIKTHKIEAIGYPDVQITKIAAGNPLGFTLTVAVIPEITLPDFKKIAKEINKDKAGAEVTDEDVEKQVKDILRQKLAYERLQKKAAEKAEKGEVETHTHADGTVHEGPAHDEEHSHEEEEVKAVTDEEIPELTDELVKELGQPGQFETVADFKAKIKEHLEIEKKRDVETAHRGKLTDKIIDESKMELPQVLIDTELNQMFAQMEEDISRAGLKFEDYLTYIKKTRDDLKKEWSPAAEKRAKLQLVLNEIAKVEKIEPEKDLLDTEVKALLAQYKDADEARVRIYVASVLTNEAVMKMLENA